MSPCETHVKLEEKKKNENERVRTRDEMILVFFHTHPTAWRPFLQRWTRMLYRIGRNQRTYADPPPTTSSGISSKKVKTMWQS